MRLSACALAAAPPGTVMRRITDYPALEARARSRGMAVERLGDAEWRLRHEFMGVRRETLLRIVERREHALRVATDTKGIRSDTAVRLTAEAQGTLISVETEVAAHGLAARLALAALTPAKGEIERRLKAGVEGFAAEIGGTA